jgi:hypothetical protein
MPSKQLAGTQLPPLQLCEAQSSAEVHSGALGSGAGRSS